ncbi:response regulator [Taibaiella lutea]|uniref:Response regulator n=1 Tax=Taibaiella lutea TaxID=2608001 RepID=A0A5M6CEM0_9BACT|nr:sigma 54-interacting response regulator [Taibaiella lutea]KAA5532342.1 response regulator [Taibaiella lutea]
MNRKDKILIVEDQFVEANHLRIMLKNAEYEVQSIARSVAEAKKAITVQKPDMVLLDIQLVGKETGIDLAKYLRQENIGFIYLSANSNEEILNAAKETHPLGFLVKPFREKDLLVTLEIAKYHQEHGLESSLRKETFFQKQLKELEFHSRNRNESMFKIIQSLQSLLPYDFAIAVPKNNNNKIQDVIGFLRIGFNEYQTIGFDAFQMITNLKTHELQSYFENVIADKGVMLYNGKDFQSICKVSGMKNAVAKYFDMASNLTLPVPLPGSGQTTFFFTFFSRKAFGFNEEHVHLCERLQYPLVNAIGNLLKDIASAPLLKSDAASAHHPEITDGFNGIIGRSAPLLKVFDYITQVASADTTVLITGESGTGKERIAESIHEMSGRKNGPMIKLNCAALPSNLIESELFGHEKGSFTGATERRVGRFEQANNGTLFLDEIGEMGLDMQSKLLRVLQEKEMERVGGSVSIKVNVRIIAATNRNLEKEVAEGRFRLDLYYRINVFPIQLPPLRDRKEDLILLVRHFIKQYNKRTGKDIKHVSDTALQSLMAYHWPGNIRELENLIERSILLSKSDVIEDIPLPAIKDIKTKLQDEDWYVKTIEENEREHILAVLNKCMGRIRGSGGAAEILGVPPTTLASKMKKLGIKRAFSI